MALSATEKENEKKTLGKGLTTPPKGDIIKEKIRKGKVVEKNKKNKKGLDRPKETCYNTKKTKT